MPLFQFTYSRSSFCTAKSAPRCEPIILKQLPPRSATWDQLISHTGDRCK